jgi:hypothetical protein
VDEYIAELRSKLEKNTYVQFFATRIGYRNNYAKHIDNKWIFRVPAIL